VKNCRQLRALMGDLLDERFYADLERDQAERATMSMLVPPQMMNTMVPGELPATPRVHRRVLRRPGAPLHAPGVLRPAHDWPSHPHASRDSLHEHDMWVVEGLTHRYPTKVPGRDAADVPAVLRALHPDGPRRQLHAAGRQAQADPQARSTAPTR
jgi:lysine 2,3-aminomutase